MGPILPSKINFNPSMDNKLHQLQSVGEITYPFPNFNGEPRRLEIDQQFHPALYLGTWLLIHAEVKDIPR